MSDELKVETDELSQLSRNMDSCYRNVCSNYKRDINTIKREMENIISRYSDYGSVVSSAKGILSSLKDIEYKTGSMEEHSQRLVTNTKQAVALYKESEYISRSIIDKGTLSIGKPIRSSGSIGSSISFKESGQLGEKSQEWEEEFQIIGGNPIPYEAGGLRVTDGNGMLAQGYMEGEHTYIKIGDVIYKNGKEVPKNDYKYVPQEIGGLRKVVGNGCYITDGLAKIIISMGKKTNLDKNKEVSIEGWNIPSSVRNRLPDQCAFLDEIAPYVAKIQLETGIPWQVMAAQVCWESGYGRYEIKDMNTRERSYNLFGIKYNEKKHGKGNYVEAWTNEEIKPSELASYKIKHPEIKNNYEVLSNGNYKVKIIAKFAKFDSMDDAFEKYKDVLLNSNFKHALASADDPIKYIKDIQSQLPGEKHPTYATDSNYVNSIISLMKKYNMLAEGITINGTVSTEKATSDIELKKALSINTKGVSKEVELLQRKLNELGYTDAKGRKLEEDGRFGANTLAAVNKYKINKNINNKGANYGIVGETTWKILMSDTAVINGAVSTEKTTSDIELKKALSINTKGVSKEVELLQRKLNELGYTDAKGRKLEEDGRFGANTLAAVNKYKSNKNINNKGANYGIVGETTWKILMSDTKVINKPNTSDTYSPSAGYNKCHTNGQFGTMYYRTGGKTKYHTLIERDPKWEAENLVYVQVPKVITDSGKISGATRLRVNKNVEKQWKQVLAAFEKNPELLKYVKNIDPGTSYARYITGSTTTPSNHCWGTAIDINAAQYPQGKKIDASNKNDPQVILWEKVFKPAGFSWGNDFSHADPMHFEITSF